MENLKDLIAEGLNRVNNINVKVEEYVKTLENILDEFGENLKSFKSQVADLNKGSLSKFEIEQLRPVLLKYKDGLLSSIRQRLIDEYKKFEGSLDKENPIDGALLLKLTPHWDRIECAARYAVPKDNEETVDQYIDGLKKGIRRTLAFVLDKE